MRGEQSRAPLLGAIVLNLNAQSSFEAIEEMGGRLEEFLSGEDAQRLTAVAVARELLASTYLGHDTALPHARLADTAPFCIAFGRSPEGISWGESGAKVNFVFLSIVPAFCATAYLEVVKNLAKALRDDRQRAVLSAAADEKTVEQWLRSNLLLI
ncbi:MAG: PTS sugar transporter subunit IIA [Opitutaceae bacterium]|jgi:mannitol/fructose-specific phosphotransferase system IIA component (Ntr-type)